MIHAEQLDAIPRDRLAALGVRARAAGARDDVRRALAGARVLPEGMRRAVHATRLAQLASADGDLARLLFAHDALTEPEAHAALGAELCQALVADGLLLHDDGRLRAVVQLAPADGAICEPHGPLGAVELAESVATSRKARRALAIGADLRACSLPADEIVAFDPRPRVAAILRANAALTGKALTTLEHLQGELGTFDLVAVDMRFDDPVERIALSSAIAALGPSGTLCAVVETVDRGLLAVLTPAEPLQLLAVELPIRPIDEACALRAAGLHPELGEAYGQAFDSAMATWNARRVSQVIRGVLVAHRAEPPFRVPRTQQDHGLAAEGVARTMTGCVLAHGATDALLAANLTIPRGTRAREHQDGLAFWPPTFQEPVALGPVHGSLLQRIHAEASVRAGIESVARSSNVSVERAIDDLLPAVREALRSGLLEEAS